MELAALHDNGVFVILWIIVVAAICYFAVTRFGFWGLLFAVLLLILLF